MCTSRKPTSSVQKLNFQVHIYTGKKRFKCYFTYLMLWIDLVILLDLYRVAAQTNKSYITQKITFIIFRIKQKYFFTLFADKTKYGYRKNDVKC